MVKPSWGLKRHCPRCGNRFYDLGKNPVPCPKCKFANDTSAPYRPRRGRGRAAAKVVPIKAKPVVVAPKPKKPVKAIEGVDLEEFEDIETIDGEEEIEEIEEVDDIEPIEEIEEDASEKLDDAIALEEEHVVGAVLVDDVETVQKVDDDEDEDEDKSKSRKKKVPVKKSAVGSQPKKSKSSKPPAKAVKAKPKAKLVKTKPAAKAKKSKPALVKAKKKARR